MIYQNDLKLKNFITEVIAEDSIAQSRTQFKAKTIEVRNSKSFINRYTSTKLFVCSTYFHE